ALEVGEPHSALCHLAQVINLEAVAARVMNRLVLDHVVWPQMECVSPAAVERVEDGSAELQEYRACQKAAPPPLRLFSHQQARQSLRSQEVPQRLKEAEWTRWHDLSAHGVEVQAIPRTEVGLAFGGTYSHPTAHRLPNCPLDARMIARVAEPEIFRRRRQLKHKRRAPRYA